MNTSRLMDSPIGPLLLISNGEALTGLYMDGEQRLDPERGRNNPDDQILNLAERELAAFFAGELREFSVPTALEGTEFQRRVWDELTRIPYGVTISYGELAKRVGNPNGSRAVGLANGKNPVSIIVPCHRVIGANGSLTGYGGGLDRKKALLELEAWSLMAAR